MKRNNAIKFPRAITVKHDKLKLIAIYKHKTLIKLQTHVCNFSDVFSSSMQFSKLINYIYQFCTIP